MQSEESIVDKHYGLGGLMGRVERGLEQAGKNLAELSVGDLAPVDAFHTRGRQSTLEVAALAGLQDTDSVLDVGCGLGGTARHLADQFKCKVQGIDLTKEYVEVGKRLTQLVGLEDLVELSQASALEIPFDDNTFDVAWTEHVQMNISDKERFYAEIARVLKPGGRFLFHDVFRGSGAEPTYPVPWAEDASISFLATEGTARAAIEGAGLKISNWTVKVDESVEFFEQVLEKVASEGPPPIGIHLLMGKNAGVKLKNYLQNMSDGRVFVALGMATRG
jgi:ubiquinone/menaquinone biosynthesis C-methylase UbiE